MHFGAKASQRPASRDRISGRRVPIRRQLPSGDGSPYIVRNTRRKVLRMVRVFKDWHVQQEDSMLRTMSLLLVLPLVFGVSGVLAQTKKPSQPARVPTAKDNSIAVSVYMKDGNKNELLLGTRIWPDYPDYNAVALQRFFALMKALEPGYKQDDEVAYTWGAKGKVTKCSIYLEAPEAGARNGYGAVVGCEANGVSSLAATSVADPKHPVSVSQDPKHLADVQELFKKQLERAKAAVSR
jgi:hypothetical protein